MLHTICSTITNGEHWLRKSLRKLCPFNSTCEWRPRNLVQRLAHSIVSQAFARRALVPTFIILPTQERFTKGSSWSRSVATIPLVTRRNIIVGGSFSSLLTMQLPLQMIDLQLHGSSAFLMRDMTPTPRVALTSMSGMHTSLPVLSTLKIEEMILALGPHGLLLVWFWTYHNWSLHSLSHKEFPTDGANCKDTAWVLSPKSK